MVGQDAGSPPGGRGDPLLESVVRPPGGASVSLADQVRTSEGPWMCRTDVAGPGVGRTRDPDRAAPTVHSLDGTVAVLTRVKPRPEPIRRVATELGQETGPRDGTISASEDAPVREGGVEPPRPKAPDPKSGVAAVTPLPLGCGVYEDPSRVSSGFAGELTWRSSGRLSPCLATHDRSSSRSMPPASRWPPRWTS